MKYTVFFDQRNRTNYQVEAGSEREARNKASMLYKRDFFPPPSAYVQEGWIQPNDGEDK